VNLVILTYLTFQTHFIIELRLFTPFTHLRFNVNSTIIMQSVWKIEKKI